MTRTLHELQLTTSRADPPPPLPSIFGSLVFLTDDEIQDAHEHDKHELIWHVSGNLRVESGDQVWLVLPGAGLWLPAGTPHAIEGSAGSRYGWALFEPDACPLMWDQTVTLDTNVLLRALMAHLTTDLPADERAHVEVVVLDLLHRWLSTPLNLIRMPRDERCRAVADALLRDPANSLDLDQWGDRVGAGARTLSRLFLSETGMSFGRWRTQARLRAAMVLLADGEDVGVVARKVGYATASAFVASFRRLTGRTPGAYAVGGAEHDEDRQAFRRVG